MIGAGPVETERLVTSPLGHRQTVPPVGPGVRDDAHLQGEKGPVAGHPRAHVNGHRVPDPAGGKLLLATVEDPHRSSGGHRQDRDRGLEHHLLLTAEAAAHAQLDHADARDRPLEDPGQLTAGVVRDLGAAPNVEPVVSVGVGDRHVGLQRAVGDPRSVVGPGDDVVGRGHGGREVGPAPDLLVAGDVVPRVIGGPGRPLEERVGDVGLVELRGAVAHRLDGVEHCRQLLVGHLDQRQRRLRDGLALGRHQGDPVPDIAQVGIEQSGVVGR